MEIDDDDDFYGAEEPEPTTQQPPSATAAAQQAKAPQRDDLEEGEEEDESGEMEDDTVRTPWDMYLTRKSHQMRGRALTTRIPLLQDVEIKTEHKDAVRASLPPST